MESTRVDKWLWGVRVYKTRSAATAACIAGHVEVGGTTAKPATTIRVGDQVQARVGGGRVLVLEVVRVIDKRVGAPVAAACVIDHSPPPPPADRVAPAGVRDRGSGRPTKRERRQLDRHRPPR